MNVRTSPDVHVLTVADKTIILVGTVHVSRESADLVRAVIEAERPDAVCVELDARRYEALSQQHKWESLDLKDVIRKKQLSTLLANLLLASYQKRLGNQLGVLPARKCWKPSPWPENATFRSSSVTGTFASPCGGRGAPPVFEKSLLLSSLLLSVFDTTPVTKESIQNLKQRDVLSEMMQEFGKEVPTLKTVLIDERDHYLAEKTLQAQGKTIVSVVGTGHVEGMKAILQSDRRSRLETLDVIPPMSRAWKWVGWCIPAVIVGSIAVIGYQKGAAAAGDNALFWMMANGVPSGLGALLAWAHPFTILAAVAGAPFTSLTPVIGVGYVTAFVQAYVQPHSCENFKPLPRILPSPVAGGKAACYEYF